MLGDCCFCRERHCKQAHLQELFSFSQREDVPVPILVPVFSTQPEQSTSLSFQPPWKVRSRVPVKTQRFLVLFLFFLHHLLFSLRNIGTQSHQSWQDKVWWPFQSCSGLQFGPEHLSKIGTQFVFHTLQL